MECLNHPGEGPKMYRDSELCEKCAKDKGKILYEKQGQKCAICNNEFGPLKPNDEVPRSAQLDHNHQTGKIREVLCRDCNMGLGQFKDNPIRLRAAADYLEKWRQAERL